MSRPGRDSLKQALKQQRAKTSLSQEVEWTMQAVEFLRTYKGENPVLLSMARKAKADLRWVPNERQVVQVHRMVHREKAHGKKPRSDALGRRIRHYEEARDPDVPDALEDPDWL